MKDFNQREVFLVVLVDGELVGGREDDCVTLGVPPDFLGWEVELMEGFGQVRPVVKQSGVFAGDRQQLPLEDSLRQEGDFYGAGVLKALILMNGVIFQNNKISLLVPCQLTAVA